MIKQLIKWGRKLAHPNVFFYCGLWMIVLLIAGTISQKYIGLYQARLQFFSSFVFWFYGLPLPGGRMAMGLILISLVLKTIYSLSCLKNKKQLGSFVMHGGVILLLTGAFITGLFSQEGYMVLEEGDSSSIVQDYHKVELSIASPNNQNQLKKDMALTSSPHFIKSTQVLKAFHESNMVKNQVLTGPFPFSLKIQEFMKNATPVLADHTSEALPAKQVESTPKAGPVPQAKSTPQAGSAPQVKSTPQGMPAIVTLKRKNLEKINEENQAGLLFQIIPRKKKAHPLIATKKKQNLFHFVKKAKKLAYPTKKNQNQLNQKHKPSVTKINSKTYALFEPIPNTVIIHGQKYIIRLQPIRTYLPFSLKLINFIKENYPGSNKAKSYQSQVEVLDKNITQRRLIKMNRPLRYKDYTFYQASYIEGAKKESSVLAVVKNAGWAFPYISSIVICVGLLLYMLTMFWPAVFHKPKGRK